MRTAIALALFGLIILAIGIAAARYSRPQTYEANMTEITR